MIGMKSNAAVSKDAMDATAKANEATANAADADGPSHQRASSAHYTASYRNRDAGNETAAVFHDKAAKLHSEKADSHFRAASFAEGEGRAAEVLSKKANLAAFGKDETELRNTKQLHADAAEAHKKASKAFSLAGKKREADYHKALASHHGDKCAADPTEDVVNA